MCIEVHTFKWRHISIEAIYQPDKWSVTAHLEIRSIDPPKAPLPITETGYLSHYCPIGSLEEEFDSVEKAVLFWLNERARSKSWQEFEERSRQGDLFSF